MHLKKTKKYKIRRAKNIEEIKSPIEWGL